MNAEVILVLVFGILFCGILQTVFPRLWKILHSKEENSICQTAVLLTILCLCVISLSADAYNPFIYFRF